MSWTEHHQNSERLAAMAHAASRESRDTALRLYADAASAEAQALNEVGSDKPRTLGITAVSAVALWFKARRFAEAQLLAHRMLGLESMPPFAIEQLRALLQAIWSEETRENAGVNFAEDAVLVSVSGGQSVTGGAPLDLIVSKVEGIQKLFYRTVEYLQHRPLRKRGSAPKDVQEICRPWLFQTAPGSYQFAVAIERLAQGNLFDADMPTVEQIKQTFLDVLKDSVDPEALAQRVPDKEYRGTFLKMIRALTPNGKDFDAVTIRENITDPHPIRLAPETKITINNIVRAEFEPQAATGAVEEVRGILRGLQLNKDWIEVTVADGKDVRIRGAGDTVDDILGPLVNKEVVVRVIRTRNQRVFRDIEAAT